MTTSASWRRHPIFDELEASLPVLVLSEAVPFDVWATGHLRLIG